MSVRSSVFELEALERHENNRVRNHNGCLCGRNGKTGAVIVSACVCVYILSLHVYMFLCLCACVCVCICKVGRTGKLWGLPSCSLLQRGKVLDLSLYMQHQLLASRPKPFIFRLQLGWENIHRSISS